MTTVVEMCLSRKVGKRFPEGRVSGAAERQRDVKDIEAAKTPGEGLPSRHAPERGCLRSRLGLRKPRLRSKRRGFGDMPSKVLIRAPARSWDFASAKSESDLSAAGVSGICPVNIVPRMRLELTRTLLSKGF